MFTVDTLKQHTAVYLVCTVVCDFALLLIIYRNLRQKVIFVKKFVKIRSPLCPPPPSPFPYPSRSMRYLAS
jgi:hypothetical protein